MWCMTCLMAVETTPDEYRDDPDDADAAHAAFDGAHEPGWIDDESGELVSL